MLKLDSLTVNYMLRELSLIPRQALRNWGFTGMQIDDTIEFHKHIFEVRLERSPIAQR